LDLKEQPEGWGTNPSYGSLDGEIGNAEVIKDIETEIKRLKQ